MKESMWGYGLALLGIMVSTVMILMSNMTTTNQQDYYLLKEVTNAAMIDSIDYGYYKKYGEMKINTEKFVENFMRRFAQNISKSNTYKIEFYSIYENPPSVSIKVTSNTGEYKIAGDSTNVDVVNSIDAVMEANNVVSSSEIFYSMPYGACDEEYCDIAVRAKFNLSRNSKIYHDLSDKTGNTNIDSKKIKISDVEYLSPMESNEDITKYGEFYAKTYDRPESIYDVGGQSSDGKLSKNIENVRMTVKSDNNGSFFLAYKLKYNCENTGKFDDSYMKKDLEEGDTVTYLNTSQYNNLTDTEKEKYRLVPFAGNCLIGIKYKVNFYYDET